MVLYYINYIWYNVCIYRVIYYRVAYLLFIDEILMVGRVGV